MIAHAGLLALHHHGRWRGVLIRGPSGAGKSDLALRLLDDGFDLVADDRVELFASEGVLYGVAPAPLKGLMELRGVGLARLKTRPLARIELAVECRPPADRMPEPTLFTACGVSLPQLALAPLEASAPAKLRRALIGLGYQA